MPRVQRATGPRLLHDSPQPADSNPRPLVERANHYTIAPPYTISYWWSFGTKTLSLAVSEIFNVKCNTMVDVTLIRPLKAKVIHFGTNRFLIYDFL